VNLTKELKMKCKLCQEFYKKYPLVIGADNEKIHQIRPHSSMSPITCYFENPKKEWNCQTVGLIRDLCYEGQAKIPYGIDYTYCEDQKYAIIKIDDIEEIDGLALWITWYKTRGGTDALWILDSLNAPRNPTEKELLLIHKHYKNQHEAKKI
jgi:hypothetical protein